MTLRIGLAGCGRVAQTHHAPVLCGLPDVRLTAVIDPDPLARAAVVDRAEAATQFVDLARALDVAPLDALVVCTPPATHAATAIAALKAGLHVYIEKPLALARAEAETVLTAAEAAGKVAMVGHNFRLHPTILAAKEAVDQGKIGAVVAVQSLFCSERRALPGWKKDPGQGGDAIMDLGIHHLDLVAHITGQEIQGDGLRAHQSRAGDGAMASLSAQLTSGAPVAITLGQGSGQNANRMEILGETGHLVIDLVSQRPPALIRAAHRLSRGERVTQRLSQIGAALDMRRKPEPSFKAALSHFAKRAASGDLTANALPLSAGLRSLALVERAQQAAAETAHG